MERPGLPPARRSFAYREYGLLCGMITYRLWRIPKAEPLVALSSFSVNTEKGPPEAQDAVTDLIGVLPQIRTTSTPHPSRLHRATFPRGGRLWVRFFDRTACQRDVEDAVPYKAGM